MGDTLFPTKLPYAPNLDFAQKAWLDQVYQWLYAETWMASTQTVAFTVDNNYFFPCDATAGSLVVTLIAANTQPGKKYLFKKIDTSANTVVITAASGDTIDGAATVTISKQWGSCTIISDGVNTWYLVAGSATKAGGGVGPLTTKGDIWGYDTADNRIPVGADGTILKSDSTQTLGVKWGTGTGVAQATVVTATGAFNFTTDSATTCLRIILQGGGGDTGAGTIANAVCGAGSGEYLEIVIPVSASTLYSGIVGAHNTASSITINGITYTAAAGGTTTSGTATGGAGGGRTGGAGGARGVPGAAGSSGTNAADTGEAGDLGGSGGGGSGTNAGAGSGGLGGACGIFTGGAIGTGTGTTPGGGGGASSFFGKGGAGGNGNGAGTGGAGNSPIAAAYGAGAGGPGAGSVAGGAGANGIQGVVIIIPM